MIMLPRVLQTLGTDRWGRCAARVISTDIHKVVAGALAVAIAPEQQVTGFGHTAFELAVFCFGIKQEPDFASDEFFCFFDEFQEVIFVDGIAHDEQVNDGAVFAHGQIAGDKDMGDMAEALDHVDDDLVKANMFQEDAVDFAEEGVGFVGAVHLFIAFGKGLDHARCFKPVQFHADTVCGITKFGFESAEVSCGVSI